MVGEEVIRLRAVDSTNSYLRQLIASGDPRLHHGLAVAAFAQTAGRGQRGNGWEAEPGMNITMSVALAPVWLDVSQQFSISEAVALATALTVTDHTHVVASVKWPNDVYVGDRKIAGILIENSLAGRKIAWSVCGIGLNVNQECFRSPAPNPVSMRQLCDGGKFGLDEVEHTLMSHLDALVTMTATDEGRDRLHRMYMQRLWRGTGVHEWYDARMGETLAAAVEGVAPTGHLTLRTVPDDELRTYAFKEVRPVGFVN